MGTLPARAARREGKKNQNSPISTNHRQEGRIIVDFFGATCSSVNPQIFSYTNLNLSGSAPWSGGGAGAKNTLYSLCCVDKELQLELVMLWLIISDAERVVQGVFLGHMLKGNLKNNKTNVCKNAFSCNFKINAIFVNPFHPPSPASPNIEETKALALSLLCRVFPIVLNIFTFFLILTTFLMCFSHFFGQLLDSLFCFIAIFSIFQTSILISFLTNFL